MKPPRVHFDPARSLLVGTFDDGKTIESADPVVLAECMFAAGARHGHVTMPDRREGDTAPATGDKIAFHHRLNLLGRGVFEPCVQLSDWTVYETDKGTRHFVGREKPPYGRYRASEAIERFDPQTGVGVDVTGQSYELTGLNGGLESTPGIWQGWVERNAIRLFTELTAEYRRAILVARVPVIQRNGQPDYVRLNDIPQPWQETFRAALHGSCCPAIDGAGECAWATDWRDWINGNFPWWNNDRH